MTAASAYSPQATHSDAPEVRSHEPSMEDILASIRRIIADDQSQGTRQGYGNGARRGALPSISEESHAERNRTAYDDVLDLARLAPAATPIQSPKAPVADRHASPPEPRHATPEHAVEAAGAPLHDVEPDHFEEPSAEIASLKARGPELGDDAHDEATDLVAFEDGAGEEALLSEPLGASVLSAFETLAATVVLQNTPMLESVMRDLLRPLLKTWLDDNLPALVERLVRIEIERVARGPRG